MGGPHFGRKKVAFQSVKGVEKVFILRKNDGRICISGWELRWSSGGIREDPVFTILYHRIWLFFSSDMRGK